MQRLFLFLLSGVLFVSPFVVRAQEITGVWEGHFISDNEGRPSSTADDRYKFEVQIAQRGKTLHAVTYSYLSTVFYGKAEASGTINVHTGKVLLQEGKLLELRNNFGGVCMMTCFFQYFKYGGEEFLEGKFVSMTLKDSSNCGRGKVLLRKKISSDFYEEPFLVERENELKKAAAAPPDSTGLAKAKPLLHHRPDSLTLAARSHKPMTKPAPPHHPDSTAIAARSHSPVTHHPAAIKPPPPLARASMPQRTALQPTGDSTTSMNRKFPTVTPRVLLDRSNQLVRSITVNTREVVLNIYDDGAIDNDTVSVYLDNKIVINHAMLTDRPLILTLHLDEDNDYHELVMVADNEGEIPPNTSLMIVKVGDKEYKVNISTTMQKNATVTFKYVKP
jgi:hypothetical protein